MGSRRRGSALVWTALVGCADVQGDEPMPTDIARGDTGHEPAEQIWPASDSPPSEDTPPVAVPEEPPTSWGEGFVDLTAGLDLLTPFAGDPLRMRSPQDAIGAFGDVDGDGRIEVLLGTTAWGVEGVAELSAYRYLPSGALERAPEVEDRLGRDRGPPFAVVDLDADGALDLLMPGPRAYVRWGDGSGGFLAETPLDLGGVGFYTGVAWSDVDRDGWLDLLIGSSACGGGVIPLLQEGPRRFAAHREIVAVEGGDAYMDAVGVYPSGPGTEVWLTIATTCDRADPHPGFYRESSSVAGVPRFEAYDLGPSDAYWRLDPISNGGPFSTMAPMGAVFPDLDGDGLFDVVLTLGVSQVALLFGRGDGALQDRSAASGVVGEPSLDLGYVSELAWSALAPDLDRDGRPDLLVAYGDDSTSFLLVRGRPMRSAAWWNAGAGVFRRVPEILEQVPAGGWRGMVPFDLDEDGDMDVILGGFGASPRVLHNRIDTGNHGLSIELRGTTSNALGAGAVVEVEADGLPTRAILVADTANPSGLARPVVYAGVGANAVARRVRVRWPSGLVQELVDLEAGRLHRIEEPATIVISEPDRRLPADGRSSLRVEVTARALDGSPRAAAIAVSLSGPGTLRPPVPIGGSTVYEVVAPAVPGSTQVEVTIDGQVLRVRPRLWWD
ncbi:MAG TPA: CRTAC1 family protein [Myxococcota bacterium]|nr:CRTAC1 family protein [Myxococcota bacterium]